MAEQSRWSDANSALRGEPTSGAVRRRRTSIRRRVVFVLLAASLPIVLVVVVVRFRVRLPDLGGHQPGPGAEVVALVAMGIGLAVEAVGLVKLFRDRPGLAWNSPLTSLSFSQRRALARSIRRQQPVSAEQHDLAVYLARRLQRQGPQLLILLGITLSAAGQAVRGSLVTVLAAVLTVTCLVVGALLVRRDRRSADRWLSRFAAEP